MEKCSNFGHCWKITVWQILSFKDYHCLLFSFRLAESKHRGKQLCTAFQYMLVIHCLKQKWRSQLQVPPAHPGPPTRTVSCSFKELCSCGGLPGLHWGIFLVQNILKSGLFVVVPYFLFHWGFLTVGSHTVIPWSCSGAPCPWVRFPAAPSAGCPQF